MRVLDNYDGMTLCWELTFQRHIPKVDHSSALIGGILCMRSMYSTLSELVSSMSENLAVSGTVNLPRSWKACKWNPWRKTEKCRFVKQMSCRQWLWTRKLHIPFPWYCSRPHSIPTASKISVIHQWSLQSSEYHCEPRGYRGGSPTAVQA